MVKIIRSKDKRLPNFVLPDFENAEESFYPFVRLPEPKNAYEFFKTVLLTIFAIPIKFISAGILLSLFAIIAKIGTLNYDPTDLKDLSTPLPLWRKICFTLARFTGKLGIWWYGFHNLSIKHYSYKDMQEKFNYIPPINIQYDSNGNELHPQCHIIASNHLGFADILFLLWHCNGSFVAKEAIRNVYGIGTICASLQSLFVEKGKSTTEALVKRVNFTTEMHSNANCEGCSLCLSNIVIFPEGTTTNGNDLLMFRTGVFNAGLPIRPVIIKCKWKSCNTAWETIHFKHLSYKVMTQFVNNMEVIIGPPYIPTQEEKKDSLLYAYNMNILMAQMMGLNNNGKKSKIYLINRDVKVNCYHHHCVHGTELKEICKWAKERIQKDTLIPRYLKMIKDDDRYFYDGSDDESEEDESGSGKTDTSWDKCEIDEDEHNKLLEH